MAPSRIPKPARKAPNPDALAYARTAAAAGCPSDQLRHFLAAGVVLQPQQLKASAAARQCDREDGPTKIGYGGARGGGKSHWGIAQVVCDDCQRFPGLKFLYLRKVGKSGREAVQDLRRSVLHSTPHTYLEAKNQIELPNGSRVILGNFQTDRDIDKYLGLEYDGLLLEEATQLTASKVKEIQTCLRTSKPGWRPRAYYTTNPGNVGHGWFKNLFIKPLRKGEERETRFIQATVRDNAFVNAGYRAELESLTGWQRKAWLDGEWDIAAGAYFTTWRHEAHVIPAFPVPKHWRLWCALDYGFTHYTAVYLLAEDGDGNVYIVDEHAERGWLPQRHAAAIHALLERHGLSTEDLWTFVAGHDVFQAGRDKDGLTIADTYRELGIDLQRADIDRISGASEILKRLGDIDAGIAPSLFIFDRCARLAECLPLLQHDPRRPEDVLKVDADADGNGGDDPYDAARYGVMAAKQAATFEFVQF